MVPTPDLQWWQSWLLNQRQDPRVEDPFVTAWAPRLDGVLPPGIPRRVVELGAGNCVEAEVFRRCGLDVWAMDVASSGLEEFRGRPGARALVADLLEPWPLPDACAGVVYSRNVLSGDFSDAELRFLLEEVWRILAPGGLFLLQVRSTDDPTYHHLGQPGVVRVSCGGLGLRFFSRKSLKSWLFRYDHITLDHRADSSPEGEAQWLCAAWRPMS